MTPDVELDRLLSVWLSGSAHRRAPDAVLRDALEEIADVTQRRPAAWLQVVRRLTPAPGSLVGPSIAPRTLRLVVVVALVAGALVALAVGMGSIDRLHDPLPSRPPSPTASTAAPPLAGWETHTYLDLGFVVDLPRGWTETVSNADYVALAGTNPGDAFSVSHAGPVAFWTCTPMCVAESLDQWVPWSAAKVLEEATAAISKRVDPGRWVAVPDGVVAGVTSARRLDVTFTPTAGIGVPQRQTYLIGLDGERVVALAWSQPASAYDPTLVDRTLTRFRILPGGPEFSIGRLVEVSDPGGAYTVRVPDFWPSSQVNLAFGPVAGLRRFGQGQLTIGISDPFGRLGICDPACHSEAGQVTVAALRQALMTEPTDDWARDTVDLGGERADVLRQTNTTRPALEHVFAVHDGRGVLITLDLTSGLVSREAFDEMIASFRYLPTPAPDAPALTLAAPDGSFRVGLAQGWRASEGTDPTAVYASAGVVRLAIFVGDSSGRIQRCDRPAGPWEECSKVRVRTLDELVEATKVKPIADHNVGPPSGVYDEVLLDGERAIVVHVQAYEYPAKSGQEVAYVLAMHDGRPYILRFRTTSSDLFGEEDVIAAFRFLR